ncbi:MAG: hypothetical protein IKN64_10180 [Desulfovibrio sp.]|nr:hypothetical protein [Desulfovibrio sp.]
MDQPLLFFCQFFVNATLALAKGALGISCFLLFTLLLAQRKHNSLCLVCSRYLTYVLAALAFAGPVSTLASFLLFIARFSAKGNAWQWPDPFSPAVLPYTVNIAIWLLVPPLALACSRLLSSAKKSKGCALGLSILLLLLCFGSFFCLSWPFAGLPPGLSATQAFTAIFFHTWHLTFFALLPASLVLLVLAGHIRKWVSNEDNTILVRRWLAGLGLIGAIPHCLNVWAVSVGYLLRAGQMPPTLGQHLLENAALSLCLVALIFAVIHKWPRKTALFEGCAVLFFLVSLAFSSL